MTDRDTSRGDGLAAEPIVAAYRERILYALALIGAVVIAPFSVLNFLKGFHVVGAVSMTVVKLFGLAWACVSIFRYFMTSFMMS